jgi:hypothetical protein
MKLPIYARVSTHEQTAENQCWNPGATFTHVAGGPSNTPTKA